MNIIIVSASNRINRLSHRVSIYLFDKLNGINHHQVTLLDLSELKLPAYEDNPEHNHLFEDIMLQMKNAEAFVFVSPEYNGTYTSALKNFIEHLVSATTGMNGGIRGGMQMQQLALSIWSHPAPVMLLIPQVDKKFEVTGKLIDADFEKRVDFFLTEFLWLAEALHEKRQSASQ
jgi:NAD(P)H-dependent FMN reductase